MTKKDVAYTVAIACFIIASIAVFLYKFVFDDKQQGMDFRVDELERISVVSLDHEQIKLVDMIKGSGTYVLLLDMNDCYTCIHKGIEDLKQLKKSGENCLVLVIHDNTEDVKGWAGTFDFKPFYIIEKATFYRHIHCPSTPVIAMFKEGNLFKYRYILN